MRNFGVVFGMFLASSGLWAQSPVQSSVEGTAPVFQQTVAGKTYTLLGKTPTDATTTTIPTVLVPVTLSFEAKKVDGKPFVMDAAQDVARIKASPIFTDTAFPKGGKTQYADALLRATFGKTDNWHTRLDTPEVKPIAITVPLGYGYVLTSKKQGRAFAVADSEWLQKEIFKQVPKQDGKLVIAVTRNTTFYSDGDATECCSWGTHGVDQATGNSFVLGSYLHEAPSVVLDSDIQPLTQQLGEFVNDPLRNPLEHERRGQNGNVVPAWTRLPGVIGGDQGRCGGTHVATEYFLMEPTNTNPKNNIPSSKSYVAHAGGSSYHLQNVALLPWYTGASDGLAATYSFPDAQLLTEQAKACTPRGHRTAPPATTVAAAERKGPPNGHELIGYTEYYGKASETFPMREISPQWDVILVAFATPDKNAPEGTMQFHAPEGMDPAQLKADISYMKAHGRKVMISLGGGGQHFTLADPKRVATYVSSVTQIVSEYGFDGIDIDFESPSLSIDPGDKDYRHPTTPSIVNLISALRQLHDHFGPNFMISLVPEGTQIPSGYPSYGGQFGSYLAITYAIKDILTFIDVQDYNTPPLQGLDGEIYQPGTVDYHAAMTELLLHGFDVGGDPKMHFDPLPGKQVAIGFYTSDAEPKVVNQALDYVITGKAPAGTTYKLLNPKGYPEMRGAMFWTIDDDRRRNYSFSNLVGPELHGYTK